MKECSSYIADRGTNLGWHNTMKLCYIGKENKFWPFSLLVGGGGGVVVAGLRPLAHHPMDYITHCSILYFCSRTICTRIYYYTIILHICT
jgi:hypothetical protein